LLDFNTISDGALLDVSMGQKMTFLMMPQAFSKPESLELRYKLNGAKMTHSLGEIEVKAAFLGRINLSKIQLNAGRCQISFMSYKPDQIALVQLGEGELSEIEVWLGGKLLMKGAKGHSSMNKQKQYKLLPQISDWIHVRALPTQQIQLEEIPAQGQLYLNIKYKNGRKKRIAYLPFMVTEVLGDSILHFPANSLN